MSADEEPRTLTIDLTPGAWALGDMLVQASGWSGQKCREWLDQHTAYGEHLWVAFTPAALRRATVLALAMEHTGTSFAACVRETWL